MFLSHDSFFWWFSYTIHISSCKLSHTVTYYSYLLTSDWVQMYNLKAWHVRMHLHIFFTWSHYTWNPCKVSVNVKQLSFSFSYLRASLIYSTAHYEIFCLSLFLLLMIFKTRCLAPSWQRRTSASNLTIQAAQGGTWVMWHKALPLSGGWRETVWHLQGYRDRMWTMHTSTILRKTRRWDIWRVSMESN